MYIDPFDWYKNPTYQGTRGNDWHTAHGSDSDTFVDRVNGHGGIDYVRTGGGNDGMTLDSNNGHWRGGPNYTGQATIADGGAGNDVINVHGHTGAFQVTTGEGKDTVKVYQADYIEIQAADGDTARDIFFFGANFSGTAKIYGVDHTDLLDLRQGGHWHQTQMHGNLAFRSDAYDWQGHVHHGTIEVMGVPASYHDAHPGILL